MGSITVTLDVNATYYCYVRCPYQYCSCPRPDALGWPLPHLLHVLLLPCNMRRPTTSTTMKNNTYETKTMRSRRCQPKSSKVSRWLAIEGAPVEAVLVVVVVAVVVAISVRGTVSSAAAAPSR